MLGGATELLAMVEQMRWNLCMLKQLIRMGYYCLNCFDVEKR